MLLRIAPAAEATGEAVKPAARLEAAEVWVEAEDGINFRLAAPGPPAMPPLLLPLSSASLKTLSLILSTSK